MLKHLVAASLLATTSIAAVPVMAMQETDPAFVAKLRATLRAHPDIITDAMQAGQAKQQADQLAEMAAKVAPFRPELMADSFGPAIGNPRGTVRVVEFVDYACPICKTAHDSVDDIIRKRPEVRVTVAMRIIFGPDSERTARFALASALQGRFPQTHDALYAAFGDHNQTKPTDEALRAIATKAGVDFDRAAKDMNGPKVSAMLANQMRVANEIGANGTPYFITSDAVYPGAAPESVMNQAFH